MRTTRHSRLKAQLHRIPRRIKAMLSGLLIIACCYSDNTEAHTNSSEDMLIDNLQDFNFGIVVPNGSDLQADDYICIYTESKKKYKITITGLHDIGSAFYLASGVNTIQYWVKWNDNKSGFEEMKASHTEKFSNAIHTLSCAGSPNGDLAQLRILVKDQNLSSAPPGVYSDTLTILLEPYKS